MQGGPAFVVDVALVTGVGAMTGMAARAIRLPSIVGYLAAGLIVGPYLPIPLFADPGRVQTLAEFGVVLVMFAIGLEFRVARLLRVLPLSGFTALVQIGGMMWAGFSLGRALGWEPAAALFLGACVAVSSTMVVSSLFAQRPTDAHVSAHVLGVLVIQDVAAIVLIAAMTAVAAGQDLAPAQMAQTVGQLIAVLVGILAVGMLIVPRVVRAVEQRGWLEPLTVLAVGLAFGVAVLAESLGYSIALGAFVAGVLVAESGLGSVVEKRIAPMRDVFVAIFFVSIGMTAEPEVLLASWPTALAIAAVVIVGQLVTVTGASLVSGIPLSRAVASGLALGQIGEFSFILAEIGTDAKIVPRALASSLVAVATLTALTTPLLLSRAGSICRTLDRVIPGRVHRLLTMHQRWVELLREFVGADAARWRRTLLGLGADGLGLIILATAAINSGGVVADWLSGRVGVSPTTARLSMLALLLLLAGPLLIGLLGNARRLAVLSATIILGERAGNNETIRTASARSLAVQLVEAIVHLVVLIGLGVPMVAVLRPVLGAPLAAPLLLVAALVAVLVVWRRATVFEGALRSGVEQVAGLVVASSGEAKKPAARPPPQVLPGLDDAVMVTLTSGAAGIGQTLAELDLRARTGITIVAIQRAAGAQILPSGQERLSDGDTLALIGPHDEVSQAEALLIGAVDPQAAAAPPASE